MKLVILFGKRLNPTGIERTTCGTTTEVLEFSLYHFVTVLSIIQWFHNYLINILIIEIIDDFNGWHRMNDCFHINSLFANQSNLRCLDVCRMPAKQVVFGFYSHKLFKHHSQLDILIAVSLGYYHWKNRFLVDYRIMKTFNNISNDSEIAN